MGEIQPKLDLFYMKVILPHILCPNSCDATSMRPAASLHSNRLSKLKNCMYCNVEEGLMIGCDDDCPYEWFHVGCVGLNSSR